MTKYLFFLYILVGMFFLSCSEKDNNETYLNVDTTNLEFEHNGGTKTFRIESNTAWNVSTTESWISVSPASGSGHQVVTVLVAEINVPMTLSGTIVVRSSDGSRNLNITVKVKSFVDETVNDDEKYIRIERGYNVKFLSDQAHYKDSILLASNVNWEMKGPSWIEAWDGSRWRPLSQQSATITGSIGGSFIYIRTADANNSDFISRKDNIVVCERLTGKAPTVLNVMQIGKYEVYPSEYISLATGIGLSWLCGSGVTDFYYNITESPINIDQVLPNITTEWTLSHKDYLNGKNGLKENHAYYINCISQEGIDAGAYSTFMTYTANSQNQPRVQIGENVVDENNIIHINCTMNEFTAYYLVYCMNGAQFRTWNDPLMAVFLYLYNKIDLNTIYYNSSGYVPIAYFTPEETDYHVVTWGINSSFNLSALIDRKHLHYNAESSTREEPRRELLKSVSQLSVEEAREAAKHVRLIKNKF